MQKWVKLFHNFFLMLTSLFIYIKMVDYEDLSLPTQDLKKKKKKN